MRLSQRQPLVVPVVVALLLLARLATGQLEIRGSPQLERFLRDTRKTLATATAASGEEMARLVVAQLRLGDVASAGRLLADHTGGPPEMELFAQATFLRVTGSARLRAQRLAVLDTELTRSERRENRSFRSAALRVHGRYCLANLRPPNERARQERTATTRLLLLEAETWQPGRGHYRPTPCNGRLLLPEAADASLLVPLSFGMRIATGDRFLKHLDSTLRAYECDATASGRSRWRPDVLEHEQMPLFLHAAAQLGDRQRLARYYAGVLAHPAADAGLVALQLDAILQAITGIRLAAGAGTSDRWLQCRPWLPTGCERLTIDGIRIMGRTLKLALRRTAPGGPTECTLSLASAADAALSVVVGNRLQQFVTTITFAEPFRCELPNALRAAQEDKVDDDLSPDAEPDHEPLNGRRFRAR